MSDVESSETHSTFPNVTLLRNQPYSTVLASRFVLQYYFREYIISLPFREPI